MRWRRRHWLLLIAVALYFAKPVWAGFGWAPTAGALVVVGVELRADWHEGGPRHALRWILDWTAGVIGAFGLVLVTGTQSWLIFAAGFLLGELLWFAAKNLTIGFRAGYRGTPEEAPALTPVMVGVDPAGPPAPASELPERIVGALDAAAPLREWGHTLREHGFCGAQPTEYVMDKGGFIVASPDPTVHPGSVASCALPLGHHGEHSWQLKMEEWPWRTAS